jgi:preprotein translocase subunit SecD
MRRVIPFVVIAVFLAALAASFLPLTRPLSNPPTALATKLGLDLVGGLRGEYRVVATDNQPVTPDILAQTRDIIEARVNATGVAEPVVQTQGSDRITVELPEAENPDEIRQLIGTTGRLDFVPVPQEFNNQVVDGQVLPAGMDPTPIFSGDQIASAGPGTDQVGQPAVDLTLKETGARLFDESAAQNVGNRFAIVLDGVVMSAPTIEVPNYNGQAQISGNFTVDTMNQLVTVLKFGSLPLEITEVGFSNLSATLGHQFLDQTLLAGLVGIGLVFVFLIANYRLPGVIACLALIFYAVANYAVFRLIPVTLTLAGIAGFVLSVGMAVDANILIFERLREELRQGKSLYVATEAGFGRAWNSIFDSNIAAILTAAILWYFGTSVVRGFALVLIIGVVISMFTAQTLVQMMLQWVVRQPWARKAVLYGVKEEEFTAVPTTTRQTGVSVRA